MGSSKKIAQGVAWTVIANVFNGIYNFVSVPILISFFGKAEYGLIGLAMSVNVYLSLMDLGFNSTNIRFFSNWLAKKEYNNIRRLFQTCLTFYGVIGGLNFVVLLLISFYSDTIFNISAEENVIIKHLFYILSISAFVNWYTSCFDQLIRAHENVGWVQKINLLPKVIQVLILFLTVTIGFTIEEYYALTTFSHFIIIPVMVWKIKQLCHYISFKPFFDKNIFRDVLPYSLNLFSFGIFQLSIVNLRPIFLGIQSSPETITEYRILNGVVNIVMLLGGAFIGVFLPSASKAVAEQDTDAKNKIAYQGTKFNSIAICFCCFGMVSVVPEILSLYVGEEYLYLSLWLDLWLLSTVVTHNQAISSLILAGSDIRAITKNTIVASIAGLLFTWFTIPYFDVGATVLGYWLYCLIQILFYYLYYWPHNLYLNSLYIFKDDFLPFFIIGLVLSVILRHLNWGFGIWVELFINGLLFAILYLLLTALIMKNEDWCLLKSLLFKRKN